jgi:hypothetical protein
MRRSIVGLALLGAVLGLPGIALAQDNPFSSCLPTDVMRFRGTSLEPVPDRPGGTRIRFTGDVVIPCNGSTLSADDVVYDKDTNMVLATGHVNLEQKDLSLYADKAEMKRVTRLGTFHNAHGTAKLANKPEEKSLFGTLEPDVWFWGDVVSKTGPTTYQLVDGGFTTCVQPTRRWELVSSRGTIIMDRRVIMKNVVLKVKDVPLLYLPYMYYPINKEDRATGFLLPTYGSSTIRGTSLSNAFFLVLGRSQDATFYHDWYTKSGQGIGSEYRYMASPDSQGQAKFYLLDEHALLAPDGVSEISAAHRSYRLDSNANQRLPHGFRLFGQANYFTDVATQQAYQNIYDFSQRQRSFSATLNGNIGRYRLTALVDRSDLFYGNDPAGTRTGHAPSFRLSLGDKPIGRSKVYFGASGEAAYLLRQDDITDASTNRSLWRFDGGPSIRAPLSSLPYLSATGSASWRVTRWQETYDPLTGLQVPVSLTRQMLDLSAQVVGPVFSRVFQTPDNGYAERFKHLIEPSFSIERTTPFREFDRVVKNDYSVDGLVGGVTTVNYKLTNRVLARRKTPGAAPGAPGTIREILSVEIGQTFYSDALAASYDPQYQSSSVSTVKPAGTFSPLQLTAVSRPNDRTSAQFRMEIDSKYRAIRTLGASGTLDSRHAQMTAGWSKRLVIEGLPGFGPDTADHFLNASTTLKTADNRLGGSYAFNYDVKGGSFLQQRIVAYYNSQCCGLSFDWQSISTPLLGFPSDRRFGISFTLAGIGSFSNPLGSFGGGGGR